MAFRTFYSLATPTIISNWAQVAGVGPGFGWEFTDLGLGAQWSPTGNARYDPSTSSNQLDLAFNPAGIWELPGGVFDEDQPPVLRSLAYINNLFGTGWVLTDDDSSPFFLVTFGITGGTTPIALDWNDIQAAELTLEDVTGSTILMGSYVWFQLLGDDAPAGNIRDFRIKLGRFGGGVGWESANGLVEQDWEFITGEWRLSGGAKWKYLGDADPTSALVTFSTVENAYIFAGFSSGPMPLYSSDVSEGFACFEVTAPILTTDGTPPPGILFSTLRQMIAKGWQFTGDPVWSPNILDGVMTFPAGEAVGTFTPSFTLPQDIVLLFQGGYCSVVLEAVDDTGPIVYDAYIAFSLTDEFVTDDGPPDETAIVHVAAMPGQVEIKTLAQGYPICHVSSGHYMQVNMTSDEAKVFDTEFAEIDVVDAMHVFIVSSVCLHRVSGVDRFLYIGIDGEDFDHITCYTINPVTGAVVDTYEDSSLPLMTSIGSLSFGVMVIATKICLVWVDASDIMQHSVDVYSLTDEADLGILIERGEGYYIDRICVLPNLGIIVVLWDDGVVAGYEGDGTEVWRFGLEGSGHRTLSAAVDGVSFWLLDSDGSLGRYSHQGELMAVAYVGVEAAEFVMTPTTVEYIIVPDGLLTRCDDPTALDDSGYPFKSYTRSRAFLPGGALTTLGEVKEPVIVASPQDGVEIGVDIIRDLGKQIIPATVNLTPEGDETSVNVKVDGLHAADLTMAQFLIGDRFEQAVRWQIDRLHAPGDEEGDR